MSEGRARAGGDRTGIDEDSPILRVREEGPGLLTMGSGRWRDLTRSDGR